MLDQSESDDRPDGENEAVVLSGMLEADDPVGDMDHHPSAAPVDTAGVKPRPMLEQPRAPLVQRLWVLLIAGSVLLLDQVTKALIEQWLPIGSSWAPFPDYAHLFQLTHTFNTGAVFGIFQGWNAVFIVIAVIVTAFILIYSWLLPSGNLLLRTALGLQLGGAAGNLVDRLQHGHVTDFMDFGPWPVWNVADLAIVSGAVLLVVVLLLESRAEKRKQETSMTQSPQSLAGDE